MKLKLPSTVYSRQDLQALGREIHEYARWSSHNAIKKQVSASKSTGDQPVLSPSAQVVLAVWMAKHPNSPQSLEALLSEIEELGQMAPAVTITLAAPATSQLKMSLVDWYRKNVAADALISFEFNATLLGGMVIRSGSRILDWSFRRQILEAREHFPEVLRRV